MLLEPLEDALVGFLLRQPRQLAGLFVHPPVGADHRELGQAVVAADLVVEWVVTRRHLQRAGAELALDALVGDHGHAALDDGNDHLATDQVPIAIVVGMHRHCDVGQDRRRSHRCDRDVTVAVGERIAHVGQRIVHLHVRDLEVGERRLVERAPVDDSVRAVDPAFAVEMHEEVHHRAHVGVVHREALAPVVHRGADAPELEHDLAAVLAQPLPDARFEGLAAEVLARLPLLREMLLDRVLGRDAGVVEAGLEERVVALHPTRADDRVGEGQLHGVTHVEVARDVRRRVSDDEALARRVRVGVVVTLLFPGLLPAFLDAFRLVESFHPAGDPSLASEQFSSPAV